MSKTTVFDLAVVGSGPAGLSAAVNAASEGLDVAILERGKEAGGQAKHSSRIENFLGFPAGVSGHELMAKACRQAQKFGAECVYGADVQSLQSDGRFRLLTFKDGREVVARTVLLSNGLTWKKLDGSGLDRLLDHGVYYGANPNDASNVAGKRVFVVGAANSAGQAAVHFSKFAKSVSMLVRGESLKKSMSQYLIDRITATSNIHVQYHTSVKAAHGEEMLRKVTLDYKGHLYTVNADGLFVFIGAEPRTAWLDGCADRDGRGYLLTGTDYQTSCPGVFAAGDVRSGSVKRIAAGVGEGSAAVSNIHKYIAATF